MSGYSRMASRSSEMRPKMMSSRLMTVANTGRRTEISEIRMTSGPGRLGDGGALPHRRSVSQVLRAFDDDVLPRRDAGADLHLAGPAASDADFTALRGAVPDDKHVRIALLGHYRGFGDDEH